MSARTANPLVLMMAAWAVWPAAAQTVVDPQVPFRVYGLGTLACAEVTAAAADTALEDRIESWVLGYVSAVGMEYAFDANRDVRLRESDRDLMMLWVEDYCLEYPQKDLTDASFYLAVALLTPKAEAGPAP